MQDNGHKNLYVLPSDNMKTSSSMTGQSLKIVVENLSPLFDYLLLDCPAGVDAGFHRAVSCADEALLVTTSCFSSLRGRGQGGFHSEKLSAGIGVPGGQPRAGRPRGGGKDAFSQGYRIAFENPARGRAADEDDVILRGAGFPPTSRIGKAFRMLAGNVDKRTFRIYDATARYTGFFGQIKRNLRRSV